MGIIIYNMAKWIYKARIMLTICLLGLSASRALFYLKGWNSQSISNFIFLKCPLLLATGWTCPTCGFGRSLLALIEGQFIKSWDFHPAGIIISSLLFLLTCVMWLNIQSTSNGLINIYSWFKDRKYISLTLLMIYSVWGLSRNIV